MRIYCFGFQPIQLEQVSTWLTRHGSGPAVAIRPEQGSATVRDLLAGAAGSGPTLVSAQPVVLFHEAADHEIQQFITAYLEASWPEPLWAMVTETNQNWTFADLVAALQAEKQELSVGDLRE
jgi:hypothetical protein